MRTGPFMAGKSNDTRERDMQLPEHLRTKLMELYAQWDELLAAYRKQAATDKQNINGKIAQARRAFDEMRSAILYGRPEVARLEALFKKYVTEVRHNAKDGSVELVIVEARRECDQMIKDLTGKL